MKLCIYPVYTIKHEDKRYKLTNQQGLVMTALLAHKVVCYDDLIEILWPDVELQPDFWLNVLYTVVCRLRRILARCGIKIFNYYGRGWSLDPPPGQWYGIVPKYPPRKTNRDPRGRSQGKFNRWVDDGALRYEVI